MLICKTVVEDTHFQFKNYFKWDIEAVRIIKYISTKITTFNFSYGARGPTFMLGKSLDHSNENDRKHFISLQQKLDKKFNFII